MDPISVTEENVDTFFEDISGALAVPAELIDDDPALANGEKQDRRLDRLVSDFKRLRDSLFDFFDAIDAIDNQEYDFMAEIQITSSEMWDAFLNMRGCMVPVRKEIERQDRKAGEALDRMRGN